MTNLDILILKPGNQKKNYGLLSDFDLTAIEPPLWASLLAAYMRQKNVSVKLIDNELENFSDTEIAETVKDISPKLLIISVSGSNPSASTMNMTGVSELVGLIKDKAPDVFSVYHGLHPSALPERTLLEGNADFVCQGEGFYTFPVLLEAIKNKADDFSGIPGLWIMENGKPLQPVQPLLFKDLGQLPMPAWDLLPMPKYRAHNWHCFDDIKHRQPYGVLYTSLGCPFSCEFCCINAIFGKSTFRSRPVSEVINEIDYMVNNYGIRNIKIIDEMFALNEKRVLEICDAISARKYNLNMWAYARVNTVTEKMLESMKASGINWLGYGFESGSKRVLQEVHKGYDIGMVDKIVEMNNKVGINIGANFIFGLPEDDMESMNQTLDLLFHIMPEWANLYMAMAYPGSRLYQTALEKKLPLPEEWSQYSQYAYDSRPLPTKYLSAPEIIKFRDDAFHKYYESEKYLSMMGKKFGTDVRKHLEEMTRTRLKRKSGE